MTQTRLTPVAIPPPGVDPYDFTITTAEELVARAGWDAANRLCWIHRAPGGLYVTDPPLPSALAHNHPTEIFPVLAKLMVETILREGRGAIAADLFGFIFTFEGYYTPDDGAHPGSPRHRPDRDEMRVALLGTFNGERRTLFHLRSPGKTQVDQGMMPGRVPRFFDAFVTMVGMAIGEAA